MGEQVRKTMKKRLVHHHTTCSGREHVPFFFLRLKRIERESRERSEETARLEKPLSSAKASQRHNHSLRGKGGGGKGACVTG